MVQTQTYSIWLIPEGEVCQNLAKIIFQLSKKYSTPLFEPHVTLIGSIRSPEEEVILKTSQLATFIPPYKIQLTNWGYFDEYTRCLFLKVRESEEVMKANLKAREIFNRRNDPSYFPHLSLIYGNLSRQIKKEIIGQVGGDFKVSFSVKSLHLFSTKGEVKAWHRVKEFALNP